MSEKPSQKEISEYLDYDPTTGVFQWKKPRGRMPIGAIAGNIFKSRNTYYRKIRLFGRMYRASHLAWVMITGQWPQGLIDHRDNDGLNNRRDNLRPATYSQNAMNTRSLASDNKHGYRGVYLNKQYKELGYPKIWYAQISHRTIGIFMTIEEAAEAYDAEAIKLYGEFAYLNFPTDPQ